MMEVATRRDDKLVQTTVPMAYLSDPCLMGDSKSPPVLQLAVNTSVAGDSASINSLKEGDDKWEVKDDLNTCDVHSSDVELKGLKRKRSMLTLRTKLEIIERIKKGEKVTKLALEYGLGKATVSDMKRQEEKIMSFISKSSCGWAVEKRKTMRKPQDVHVEKALFMWLNRERKKGSVISGPALMEKAKSFHKQLYGNESSSFKASSGWLHRFKLRNGIKQPRAVGSGRTKKLSQNENSAIQFQLDVLRRMIQDHLLGPDQIYTVSINRLHWKALPFKVKRRSKSCVTVLTCVNASGSHKLRPSLIGRTEVVKVLGDANVDRLPFRYYYQENGWVDAELFQVWFQDELVPQLQLYYSKALLLLDDTLFNLDQSPLTNDDGKYMCISVPSIVSFVVQPINNYLFDTLKFRYRTQMVEHATTYQSTKRSQVRFAELNRCISLRDAGYILSEAWDSVVGDVIKRFWMNTLYCLGAVDEQTAVVDDILNKVPEMSLSASCDSAKEECWKQMLATLRNYDRNVTEDDVADWIALDGENLGDNCVMTDKDIIELVRCELTDSESEEDVNQAVVDDGAATVPTNSEAYACFNKCLLWLERQKDCETSHLQLLWKLQNVAAKRKSKR